MQAEHGGAVPLLIGALLTVSLGVTTLFWRLGAWPVAGFNGADLLLAALLLRLNFRARRASETIRLTEGCLTLTRCDDRGRVSARRFPTAWLALDLEERPGRVTGLFLRERATRIEIAASLGDAAKRDLAQALGAALHRTRHPVFDNPQLREAPGARGETG